MDTNRNIFSIPHHCLGKIYHTIEFPARIADGVWWALVKLFIHTDLQEDSLIKVGNLKLAQAVEKTNNQNKYPNMHTTHSGGTG